MADEIRISFSMSLQNGNLSETFSGGGSYDQTSAVIAGGVVQVGTATQTISLGDVQTAGFAAFRSPLDRDGRHGPTWQSAIMTAPTCTSSLSCSGTM